MESDKDLFYVIENKWSIGKEIKDFIFRQRDGNFNFYLVKNLSAIDTSQLLIPIPGVDFNNWFTTPSTFSEPSSTSAAYEESGTTEASIMRTSTEEPPSTIGPLTTSPDVSSSDPTISLTDTPTIEQETSPRPDSPIGYEIPCGIRGARNASQPRVVGGSDARKGEFPWLVSVQVYRGSTATRHICGGTIISSHWVLTAAHCVHKIPASSLTIVAGDYDLYETEGEEQRTDVVRIIPASGFVRSTFANDIALLQIEPPLRLDPASVAPICLPAQDRKFDGGRGVLAGWGRLSEEGNLPDRLQRVSIPIIEKERCDRLYQEAGYGEYVHPCQLCAGSDTGGLDSCQGDSGGGLGCLGEDGVYYACGLVSWGLGCARPESPGLYTQVSCFSQWIYSVLYNVPSISSVTPIE